ncbi:MAG: hypothetical protein JWR50_2204 [Mucilaginibacter sp.]|nr:hypothetical protein [Mucilaginibacter sp.]
MINDCHNGDRGHRDGRHGHADHASLDHFCETGVRGTQLNNLKGLPR